MSIVRDAAITLVLATLIAIAVAAIAAAGQ